MCLLPRVIYSHNSASLCFYHPSSFISSVRQHVCLYPQPHFKFSSTFLSCHVVPKCTLCPECVPLPVLHASGSTFSSSAPPRRGPPALPPGLFTFTAGPNLSHRPQVSSPALLLYRSSLTCCFICLKLAAKSSRV